MELIALAVGVVSLIATIVGIYVGWWAPKATRIRQALRAAKPTLYFTIGSYGGAGGQGLGMNLQNRGPVSAYNVALYLPGISGPTWQVEELVPGATPYVQIPVAADGPIRTTVMQGIQARLIYTDRFQRQFAASLDLVQQPRNDGFYNVGAAPHAPTLIRPATRFRDLWRLRKMV